MARLPQPGGDTGSWGEILNDYLEQSIAPDGTLKSNSVGNTQLQNNTVTSDKLSANTPANGQVLSYSSGDLMWVAPATVGAITSSDITDATTTGKALLTATDPAAARNTLGAGTSNLTIGTTSTTAKAGNYQPDASEVAGLATVATSGSYTDLTDKPTITAPPVTSVASKTGAVTLVKADVGLTNVDNTSDANKPVSTAVQAALDLKASDATTVKTTGTQTVAGLKTFSSSPVIPAPTTSLQAATKSYADDSRIDILNKLAPFYAAASAFRNSRPVIVAIAGASVAAQISADRWTHQFNARLQATFPKSSGTEQPIVTLASAVASAPSGTGVLTINAAVGGTTTSNYLTSTTRAQLMNLHPSVIIHADMPANDYGAKTVTPATVKANMISQLTALDALGSASYPCVHVVVGGYYPTITGAIAPIAEFRQAMREATEGRPNAIYIDTYDFFTSIGVGSGGSDPLSLLLDGLHPNANGHKVLADHVSRIFNLFPIASIAAPAEPVATIITSDNFTTDSAISGRTANAALGGSTATWAASGPVYVVSGGVLAASTTAQGAVQISLANNLDIQASATFISYSGSGIGSYIELYRKVSGACYVYGIGAAGTLRLAKSDGTLFEDYGLTPAEIANKKLTIRYYNGAISAYIDGVLQSSHQDTSVVRTSSGAGFSRNSGTLTATWDNFVLESLV